MIYFKIVKILQALNPTMRYKHIRSVQKDLIKHNLFRIYIVINNCYQQMPQWITEQKSTSRNDQRRVVCYSSTSDSIGSSLSMEEGTSRHKRSHSASSSNSHNGDCSNDDGGSGSSVKKPSMKRQRLSVTPVSPDINEVYTVMSVLIGFASVVHYI